MDFFQSAHEYGAKNYVGCVAALQEAQMMHGENLSIAGSEVESFPPGKKDKGAIVNTSRNFRKALYDNWDKLSEDERAFAIKVLQDFSKKGLKMPMLGMLEVCPKDEATKIKDLAEKGAKL